MKAVVFRRTLIVLGLCLCRVVHGQTAPEPPRAPEPAPAPPPAEPAPAPPAESPAADAVAPGEAPASSPAASAVEAEQPTDQAEPGNEEIVVTAQKRQDRLLAVPISVSVLSGEALRATGAKNLTELQGLKPGVYFSGDTSYGGAPMAMRGTAGSNTALLDDPVAVYVDGIYLPSGSFSSTTLLDVAGIEVVRGPQGTLQGRNATAGSVIVRNNDPKFAFGGYGRALIAAPLEYRLEAAVTGPILDTLAVRASFGWVDDRGWADNTFDGTKLGWSQSLLGRLSLLFVPNDRLSVRLASSYSLLHAEPALTRWAKTNFNPDPNGPLMVPVTSPPADPPSPYQVTPTVPLDPADRERIEDGKFALNRDADAKTVTSFNSLFVTYSFPDFADLISLTGLVLGDTNGDNDSDGLAVTDREGYNHGEFDGQTVSEELRLQSNTADKLSWILGAYYSFAHQDMDFRIYNLSLSIGPPFAPPPTNRRYTAFIADQDDTSYAAFADATYQLIDALALTAGVRYTYEKKAFDFDSYARVVPGDEPIPTPPVMSPSSPSSWNDVSYRAKLLLTPIDPLLIYASFSKGFKSGGYNAFGVDPAFDPEYVWSSELGAKVELPERRGWVAGSAFYNNYDGLQVRSGVQTGGVAITNAADAIIKGFEVEAQTRVVAGLSFQGNVAYTHAQFESFPRAYNLVNQQVDATGNWLPRTPLWQFFAQASYDQPLAEHWSARADVSYRWRDTVYFAQTDQNASTVQGEPIGELGARLAFYYDPINLSVALFGNNLTNARSVNGFNPNFGYPEVSFNKPRVLGVEVEERF